MARYISALDVSTDREQEEELKQKGFQKIPVNLNQGTEAENAVFLWYRRGPSPVTRVRVSFSEDMEAGLKQLSYRKVEKNLNTGTSGKEIYLWFSRTMGRHDSAIVEVDVSIDASEEAAFLRAGGLWEDVSCNLNLEAGGNMVYAWLRRERRERGEREERDAWLQRERRERG